MRLESIKLVGFKSFVDLTSIAFPSDLIGIVGPNGCGKSNIIDAVKWVMGESSAKQLRGEAITDVIFNGSVNRKPVGQASIELIFDNGDGTIGGEYAKYSQISVRRVVNRDGVSNYFLNGTNCRRKDITGVFLGTGLGPRSYSIIEQGMISGIVEAKPEELRAYLEEVAGISKYKERRRETENRLRHTTENLSRISDLREELRKTLDRLKRQSRAAKRYKVLKEEERLLKAQLLALRWKSLGEELANFGVVVGKQETLLESHRSAMQHAETEIEKERDKKTALSDTHNEIQGRYYAVGNEISKLEQNINHQRERHQQLIDDLERTQNNLTDSQHNLAEDENQLKELVQKITELAPELEQLQAKAKESQNGLLQAEQKMQQWQHEWDEFNVLASSCAQKAEVEQTRIQHYEQQQLQAQQRLGKIEQELTYLNAEQFEGDLEGLNKLVGQADIAINEVQVKLDAALNKINTVRGNNLQLESLLQQQRDNLQDIRGRYVSLEALQQAALGKKNEGVISWLEKHQLEGKPRLAQNLQVDAGWEKAVETVLGAYLEAVCVDSVDVVASVLNTLEQGTVTLFDINAAKSKTHAVTTKAQLLSAKLQSDLPLTGLLNHVYVADSLAAALAKRDELKPYESVITADGVWMGHSWLRVAKNVNEKAGVIWREGELKSLKSSIDKLDGQVACSDKALKDGREELIALEAQREELQQLLTTTRSQHADNKAKHSVKLAQIEQVKQRKERLTQEIKELKQQNIQDQEGLIVTRDRWQEALQEVEKHADKREELLLWRDESRKLLENARQEAHANRDDLHELEMQVQSARNQQASLTQAIVRTKQSLTSLTERRVQLEEDLAKADQPVEDLKVNLEKSLALQVGLEKELAVAKKQVDEVDYQIQELTQKRSEVEQEAEIVRGELEEKRLKDQEIKVRQATLLEQINETKFNVETLLTEIPQDAVAEKWTEEVELVANRIHRLGPINLVAIEEFEQQSERKEYLDAQHTDLEEAMQTLRNVIQKIDRETRSRFQDTYEKVNTFFQQYFPRVFGGGTAHLQLLGEDLLSAGVSVMAKPPGKHISNIHQLSGGEKALTAISLVFALFQLNPSPFCILDEVDAPLDDNNVDRFCELVKEMSAHVQFIFVSHNKLAIEMADHLMGVTMSEPGVSRIVSVDVAKAVAMIEG
jgi:chromosome segregation protein